MATIIRSIEELLTIYVNEVKAQESELTDFEEGSINDLMGGASVTAVSEIMKLIIDEFAKTFFGTARGPDENGGGTDELEALAIDHFGDGFARPGEQSSKGIVTFSRPTTDDGLCVIAAGTIVKTEINANGESQRFITLASVNLSGLTVNASIEALVAGSKGNVGIGDISVIETTLTDPTVTVSNAAATAGGEPEMSSPEYREYIKQKIIQLRGATKQAIESAANAVAGVEIATAIEIEKAVIEFDIATNDIKVGATYFRIPYVTLYIADANGTADDALVAQVEAAIADIRAYGVRISVVGATALSQNWTAALSFNPGGPNYAELSADPQQILDSMSEYIDLLPIGGDFIVASADAAILAIWGPSGTNDLTDFETTNPVGDVTVTLPQKLIPGTMAAE